MNESLAQLAKMNIAAAESSRNNATQRFLAARRTMVQAMVPVSAAKELTKAVITTDMAVIQTALEALKEAQAVVIEQQRIIETNTAELLRG